MLLWFYQKMLLGAAHNSLRKSFLDFYGILYTGIQSFHSRFLRGHSCFYYIGIGYFGCYFQITKVKVKDLHNGYGNLFSFIKEQIESATRHNYVDGPITIKHGSCFSAKRPHCIIIP